MEKRRPTLGCCGLDCGLCPRYHASGASRCPGCGGPDFAQKHPARGFHTCCFKKRGLEACAHCAEYPCPRFDREDGSRDSFITHRRVRDNQRKIREAANGGADLKALLQARAAAEGVELKLRKQAAMIQPPFFTSCSFAKQLPPWFSRRRPARPGNLAGRYPYRPRAIIIRGRSMKRAFLLAVALLLLGAPALPAAAAAASPAVIEVRTARELAAMAKNPDGHYVLKADIDLRGIPWTPFAFAGVLDGAGHTVYNLRVPLPGLERETSYDGNRVRYDTVYAGLFSTLKGAVIRDLTLQNAVVRISTAENCFAAGLAGFTQGVTLENVRVTGRVYLDITSRMGGVGGIVGFGDGVIRNSRAEVELVFVDLNRWAKCEQFLGGIAACGYLDMENCSVKLEGYASVHGYVHSGGLLGMYHVHDDRERKVHQGYVRGCTVDAHIRFFENNRDRRAYCRRFVGEPLDRHLKVEDNVFTRFIRDERTNYRVNLLPETCETPDYLAAVTPPAPGAFGFTTYVCRTCGYTYTDDYTALPGKD